MPKHKIKAGKNKSSKKEKNISKKPQKAKIEIKKKKIAPKKEKTPIKIAVKPKKPIHRVGKEKIVTKQVDKRADKRADLEKKKIRIFSKEKQKTQKQKNQKIVANPLQELLPTQKNAEPAHREKVLIPSPSEYFKMVKDFNQIILDLDENINFDVLKVSWELLYSLKSNIDRKIRLFREVESKKELDRIFNALK